MTSVTSLVVGGGGFLGTAVADALRRAGDQVVVPSVPWREPDRAARVLGDAVHALRSGSTPWRLVWCAGTGIVASGDDAFETERLLLDAALSDGSPARAPGTVFFASSAGATYAGSTAPDDEPFDERTVPRPLAPYGTSRLVAEDRFRSWTAATGARLLIGRIANLYGPGANLRKPQGLVSQLALAHLERRPSTVYVPFDTTRDYLYIDDAAEMVLEALRAVQTTPAGTTVVKVFASQQGRTITEVVEAVTAAIGAPLDVRTGDHDSAAAQARRLRFRSVVLPEVDDRVQLSFDEGVRRTVAAVRAAVPARSEPPRPVPTPDDRESA